MARTGTKLISRGEAQHLFAELRVLIREQVPDFEVRFKDEHFLQRVVAILIWVFNRKYMTKYVTTMYPRVYFPSRKYVDDNPWKATKILAHEYVHLFDAHGEQRWWKFQYLNPQIGLALGAVIGLTVGGLLLGPPWWVYLFGLLALVPWPAAFRRDAELRGYAMNLVINVWKHGTIRRTTIEWMVSKFTGPDYFFMWPFRRSMTERVLEIEGDINFGRILKGPQNRPYREVIAMLDGFDT